MLQDLQHQGRHLETSYYRRVRTHRRLNITTAILFCSLAALFIGTGMLVHQVQAERDATAERSQLNAHIRELQNVLIMLEEAETSQRGYLLTGKLRYLVPYRQALHDLPALINRVSASNAEDSLLVPHMRSIRLLSESKLAELTETIRLNDAGEHAAAMQIVQTDSGQQYMEQVRAEIADASDVLSAQRDAADARVLGGNTAVKRWTVLTVAALTICIGFFMMQIRSLSAARSRFEKRILTQSSILNAVVDEIPAMVSIWDQDQKYRLVNKAFENRRRKSRAGVVGKTIEQVIGSEEYQQSAPFVARALRGEMVSYEKHCPGADVEHVSVTLTPLFLEGGEVCGVIALAQDVTRQHAERDRLKQLSESDSLTGLLNRSGFEAYLERRMQSGMAEQLGLLYIDLDHFKPVNDRYGHAAGDEVLRVFAQRLRQLVRPTDAVARLGGDEFAIALNGIRNHRDAEQIGEKVVAAARRPIDIGERSVTIGASVGAAFDATQGAGWQGLIARADALVYEAKANGRGRAKVYILRS